MFKRVYWGSELANIYVKVNELMVMTSSDNFYHPGGQTSISSEMLVWLSPRFIIKRLII